LFTGTGLRTVIDEPGVTVTVVFTTTTDVTGVTTPPPTTVVKVTTGGVLVTGAPVSVLVTTAVDVLGTVVVVVLTIVVVVVLVVAQPVTRPAVTAIISREQANSSVFLFILPPYLIFPGLGMRVITISFIISIFLR
jgi:hypothetical protein